MWLKEAYRHASRATTTKGDRSRSARASEPRSRWLPALWRAGPQLLPRRTVTSSAPRVRKPSRMSRSRSVSARSTGGGWPRRRPSTSSRAAARAARGCVCDGVGRQPDVAACGLAQLLQQTEQVIGDALQRHAAQVGCGAFALTRRRGRRRAGRPDRVSWWEGPTMQVRFDARQIARVRSTPSSWASSATSSAPTGATSAARPCTSAKGMASVRSARRCATCAQVTTVLAARVVDGEVVPASGRGRCSRCASQRLRPAPDVDAFFEGESSARVLSCPTCSSALIWHSIGMWD